MHSLTKAVYKESHGRKFPSLLRDEHHSYRRLSSFGVSMTPLDMSAQNLSAQFGFRSDCEGHMVDIISYSSNQLHQLYKHPNVDESVTA